MLYRVGLKADTFQRGSKLGDRLEVTIRCVGGIVLSFEETMNPKVDEYLRNAQKWRKELETLRRILLDCGLTEELKWRSPCYTFQKKNVAIMGELKDCCTLGFFKGALLKDAKGLLEKPGENTQAARRMRFVQVEEVLKRERALKAFVREAMKVEEAGLEVEFKKTSEFEFPEELQKRLEKDPALKKAFERLTPGRQRGYLLHFSSAKQAKTRESRIEACVPRILEGKGLRD